MIPERPLHVVAHASHRSLGLCTWRSSRYLNVIRQELLALSTPSRQITSPLEREDPWQLLKRDQLSLDDIKT